MATYDYDDFHLTLTPRSGETYDVRAVGVDGVEHLGAFTVPLSNADLEHTVLGLAARSRTRRMRGGGEEPPASPVRDMGGGGGPPRMDAKGLGAALADALLGGEIGRRYDEAMARAADAGRGLRLSLSLADAPELLNLPWEFLYRRPRFLASQAHSPLVRHLDTGSHAPPPSIETTVRMLGVIADPDDLTPLDVASERQRVEEAAAKVTDLGRIELDWLEPATPRTLRQKLRDDSYHILHYVGHSDFTADGEGILFLQDMDRRSVPIDSTALANLLAGQSRLRLVVLNSCDGARTSLVDPYAGVATTLIQLGVPAVVAMQFEITDRAAICFAEELYTNLIGRQAPIDAAVAEARLAVYIEVDKVEWATPVLFVRHPDVELFRFMVDPAPLPPPPSIDHERPPPPPQPPPPPPPWWKRRWVPLVAAGAVTLAVAAALLVASRDDGGGVVPEPPRPPPHNEASRAHTGDYALEILGAARDSKLYIAAPGVGLWFGQVSSFGAKGEALTTVASPEGASDTQPAWDRNSNRLAFVRSSEGTASIWYVVPGETSDDPGKQPARLITPVSGESHRFPTWGRDGALFYVSTVDGCTPGPGCAEVLHRATFSISDDDAGFFDVLHTRSDELVAQGFSDVRSIAPDPMEPTQVAVVDAAGLHLVEFGGESRLLAGNRDLQFASFVLDSGNVVATTRGVDAAGTHVLLYDRDGGELDDTTLAGLDRDHEITDVLGRSPAGATIVSMTPEEGDTRVEVTIDERNDEYPPALLVIGVSAGNLFDLHNLWELSPMSVWQALGQLESLAQ